MWKILRSRDSRANTIGQNILVKKVNFSSLTEFSVFTERDARVMNVHSVRYKWVCFTDCIIAYILLEKCNRFMTDAG